MLPKRVLIAAITLLSFLYVTSTVILLSANIETREFNVFAKGLIAAMFAFTILLASRDDMKRSTWGWPIVLFLGVYSVRLIYDVFARGLLFAMQDRFYILSYFFGLTLLPTVAILLHMRRSMVRDLHNWLLFAVIIGNLLLTLYFFGGGVVQDETRFFGRAQIDGEVEGSAVINPITVSLMGVQLFVMALGRMLTVRTDPPAVQAALGLLTIYSVFNIVIGGSRGPILALAVCILAVGFLSFRGTLSNQTHVRRGIFAYLLIGLAGAISYVSVAGRDLYIYQRFVDMLETRLQGGREERDYLLADAWNDFLNSPLIGESYVMKSGGYPHNFIVESLMATGIVGTTFLLLAFVYVLTGIWRLLNGRAGPYGISLALLAICYIVTGLVSGTIGQHPDLWACMAIMTVLGWERAPQKADKPPYTTDRRWHIMRRSASHRRSTPA